MNVLRFRVLKSHSNVIVSQWWHQSNSNNVRALQRFHSNKPWVFTSKRLFMNARPSESFQYQYDQNELVERIGSSSKVSNEFTFNDVKHLLSSQDIELKDDIQSVINSVILAARNNESAEPGIEPATLDSFLERLNRTIDDLNADELVSTLVALNILNVPLHNETNRQLIIRTSRMLNDSTDFSLMSLCNLAIFSRKNHHQIYPYNLCSHGTSQILKYMENSTNLKDLTYVTLYLESLNALLTKDIMTAHKAKMKDLLIGVEAKPNIKELIMILKFYKMTMFYKNSRIIRNMILLMADEIPNLSNSDLQCVAMTRDTIHEPASVIPIIVDTAESRPDKSTDLDLIYCRLSKHMPEHLQNVSRDLFTLMDNLPATDIIKNDKLFSILKNKRYIYIKEIYQKYWKKVAEDLSLINTKESDIDSTLSSLCYRYCLLHKGMTSKYRCQTFESLLRELVLMDIKDGVSGWKPFRVAKYSTFIIGYASETSSDIVTIPEYFVQKIEEMANKFTVNEIIDISIGLEFFHRRGIPKNMNKRLTSLIVDRIGRLENVVDGCIERMIDDRKSLQIDAICLLIRAYANQKVIKQTRILDKLVMKLEEVSTSDNLIITPRTISNVTGSLNRILFITPKLCERMINFVNENMDIVGADTTSYLLFYLFSMGYDNYDINENLLPSTDTPKNIAELIDFDNFARAINRDFELIPAWLIVQACLSLSYYNVLTIELINKVFNIDFIARLEKELCLVYDSKSYPKNILNLVMQLNRSVCLNYPEAGVPWFQQNFIEAQLLADPPKKSAYLNDIYKMLLTYVGGDKSMIRVNHVTPYGYRIPFVIYFNSHKQLVPPPYDEGPQSLNKVAIIPLLNHSFRLNDSKGIRGFDRMQERHLGILGYDVVQICYREWNSIHMNLPGARENFLRTFLHKYNALVQ